MSCTAHGTTGTVWSTAFSRVAPVLEEDRVAALDKMRDILNRRAYVRNLLRDIDEVLE